MKSSVKKLFQSYETAFAAGDAKTITSFYSRKFIAANPSWARVFRRSILFRLIVGASMKKYKKLGMHSVKMLELTETPISNQFTLVKVHYGVKFHTTGEKLIEFDVSYLVSMIKDEPEIILFISHEDEQERMKKEGVV